MDTVFKSVNLRDMCQPVMCVEHPQGLGEGPQVTSFIQKDPGCEIPFGPSKNVHFEKLSELAELKMRIYNFVSSVDLLLTGNKIL